jgi:hypothetical protein
MSIKKRPSSQDEGRFLYKLSYDLRVSAVAILPEEFSNAKGSIASGKCY